MPEAKLTEDQKEQIRKKVWREFPASKCLREIHYHRYVMEAVEQAMSPAEIVRKTKERAQLVRDEMSRLVPSR